ncbi:hypothetical protein HELRODRAFT_182716 [Helobdella robusta]|uniref:Uncharacterized protein n=1 Tax=Helobdella robusta TaxID=6412 RepID=T1FIM9_HELRO|nr:hypothetical protein HELRODRAFT_182716 [Helobdella robusta]ESN90219.1 hypothetical protein HELRODRAFT_182716 [Helobdella robusta]
MTQIWKSRVNAFNRIFENVHKTGEIAPAHSSLSTPNNNINKNNSNSSGHEVTSKKRRKYTPIIVGSKQPWSFKLSAAPLPPKKIVFGVGKLKSCVKEEILEHLETIGLTAAECVPVFKFSPTRPQPSTSDPSTKFRITIFKHQEMIFTNPENWPIGVEIHPWLFHARPQHLIKPTTTSLPNHYPVDLPNVNTPSLVNSHQHVENTVEVASILTSSEESTQPIEPVTMGPSQLVEPHKQQQASSMMSPPSDVNSATSINHDNGC